MAEAVRTHRRYACPSACSPHHLLHRVDADASLRSLDPEEEPASGEFGPAPEDVRSQGFANIRRQRQPVMPSTLSWNYDFAARPVEMLQFECSNLACSQPHSGKQHENGSVASASHLELVAAGEQTR